MKQMTHDWGRYFERMTAWKKVKGKDVTIINPLDDLIRFMRDQIESERTYRNAYEMTIYDPARDAGKVSNRQCLSFLSFKLTRNKELLADGDVSQSRLCRARAGQFSWSRAAAGIRSSAVRGKARLTHLHLNARRD